MLSEDNAGSNGLILRARRAQSLAADRLQEARSKVEDVIDNATSGDNGVLVRARQIHSLAKEQLRSRCADKMSWGSAAVAREVSQDSFASASEGEECADILPPRPDLPRLQQSYAAPSTDLLHKATAMLGISRATNADTTEENLIRPNFLPPELLAPQAESSIAGELGPMGLIGVADELFRWLPSASGDQMEDVAHLASWLVQLLRWRQVPEFAEEIAVIFNRLASSESHLQRLFTEASSSQCTSSEAKRDLGLAPLLPSFVHEARVRLQDAPYQRAVLCLFALLAAVDPAARESLRTAGSAAVAAAREHPDDAGVRFWARTCVASLGSLPAR